MKKSFAKLSFATIISAFMVLVTMAVMTVPAFAEAGTLSLSDTNIGLSYTVDENITAYVDETEAVRLKSAVKHNPDKTGTLVITNKYAKTMTLKFVYDLYYTGIMEVLVDGESVIPEGTSSSKSITGLLFEKSLASGESVTIIMKTKTTQSIYQPIVKLMNIRMIDESAQTNVTFEAVENGTYTVGGTAITETTTVSHDLEVPYVVKAAPASDYRFAGWYNVATGDLLSEDAETSLNITADCKIAPKFIHVSAAIWKVGTQYFGDLSAAVSYAQANGQSVITLKEDTVLNGQYTIPTGITLLIPFDDEGTLYTDKPDGIFNTSCPASTPYRTLTMTAGSSITVDGAISVSGKHHANSTPICCRPAGPYGHIKMENGSKITLNDGAKLYAWGYITGDGNITANSGAEVYEYFQIVDWRGGSMTSSIAGNANKVFPL